LSYDKNIAESMSTTDVVVNMLKVMKGVSKEKVLPYLASPLTFHHLHNPARNLTLLLQVF